MPTKYMRAVSGNWGDDSTWSTTSGGAADTTKPTSSDDVICNAASGSGTLTVNEASACKSLDFTGFTGTFAGTNNTEIYGDLTFGASGTYTHSGVLIFKASGNIISSGSVIASNIIVDETGITVALSDTCNMSNALLRVYKGTFTTNNFNITCGTFGSTPAGDYTRVINMGSSSVTCSFINFTNAANLTFNYGTSSFVVSRVIVTAGKTFYNVTKTAYGGGGNIISGAFTCNNLTIEGWSSSVSYPYPFTFDANIIVNGTFTANGVGANKRIWISSDLRSHQRTITATNVSISNVDFTDIVGAGAGTWSGTSIGNGLNNSGITFTPAVDRHWVDTNGGLWSATTSWSDTSGGSSGFSVPLIQDTVYFNANSITSGSATITVDTPRIGNCSFTTLANTPYLNFSQNVYFFYGFNPVGKVLYSGSSRNFYFENRAEANLDIRTTINYVIGVYCYGSKLSLQNNFANASYILVGAGEIDFNDYNVTLSRLYTDGTQIKVIRLGNGTITLTSSGTSSSAPLCLNSIGTTLYAENSTVVYNSTDATTNKDLNVTVGNLNNFTYVGSGKPCVILNSNTFNELKVDSSAGANTLTFTNGTNQTITNFRTNGSAGKLITLNSSTPGSPATITCDTQNQFLQGVTMQDITFAGKGIFWYDSISTVGTGVTGAYPWIEF